MKHNKIIFKKTQNIINTLNHSDVTYLDAWTNPMVIGVFLTIVSLIGFATCQSKDEGRYLKAKNLPYTSALFTIGELIS